MQTRLHRIGHCSGNQWVLVGDIDGNDARFLVYITHHIPLNLLHDGRLLARQHKGVELLLSDGIFRSQKPAPPRFHLVAQQIVIIGHHLCAVLAMHFNIKEAGFEVDRIHEVGIEVGRNGISIF